MAPNFDVLVIGSGFGGAVTACRLAEAGMKVLVLERGRRWEVKDYPSQSSANWLYDNDKPQREYGWVDWRFWGNMTVVCGAAVGGGSLIYANVSAPAHPEAFNKGWPPEITRKVLDPYYDRVGKMLRVQTIPDNQLTYRFKLVQEAAQKAGYGDRFVKMPIAVSFSEKYPLHPDDPRNNNNSVPFVNDQGVTQGTCVHCANCDFGCQVHAKNTLDLNYIPQAEKYHAEVRPLHYVRFIEPIDGGYRVTFDQIIPGSGFEEGTLKRGSETARKVIISAGSLGSTELLLRCRDQYKTLPNISQFLGHNWSSNGDFLTLGIYPESRTVAPMWGPTITCYINFLDQPFQDQRFVVEDGGFPPLLNDYLLEKLRDAEHGIKEPHVKAILDAIAKDLRRDDPLSNIMPWFANGVDRSDGQLYLGRKWWWPWQKVLKLNWPKDLEPTDAIIAMHTKLTQVTGGREFVSPTWTDWKWLITPHPLGGCNMGVDAAHGVVDHTGAVFGYPGLHVADGAIVPEAIGINPSRTIAALAERSAEFIAKDLDGRTRATIPGN
ncbi:MAG TPA: GMC family oxidoreductase [Candidatus Angelobacter sp.]|nr:GMC family oxidoreductase [Candidatus Angelobacter sp.]